MLKKAITYDDLDGNTITEDFYFHFTKAELIEMQFGQTGLTEERLNFVQQLVADIQKTDPELKNVKMKDLGPIILIYKDMIQAAIGKRSADGKRFIKNQDVTNEFIQTEAYSALFMELATDSDSAAAFVNGLMPKNMDKSQSIPLPDNFVGSPSTHADAPATDIQLSNNEQPETDVRKMTNEELIQAYKAKLEAKNPK